MLVAEDHSPLRALLVKKLRPFGYTVHEAGTGVEAVSAHSKYRPDLIIMDGNMPEMDGYEATEQIRANEKQDDRPPVPIIGFTGDPDGERKCSAAGMDFYIGKEIKPLLDLVRSLLDA